MDAKTGGIAALLGLASYDGYECENCGTLVCQDCYRKRVVELAGAGHDRCPACDGLLSPR
ncbi:hypothetical protein [Halobaculum sp. D14]|uniref:hypothetical protein n=1 Tax=unclassified Halobaculum TaxID=2640896 RepID=UPI003EBEEA82